MVRFRESYHTNIGWLKSYHTNIGWSKKIKKDHWFLHWTTNALGPKLPPPTPTNKKKKRVRCALSVFTTLLCCTLYHKCITQYSSPGKKHALNPVFFLFIPDTYRRRIMYYEHGLKGFQLINRRCAHTLHTSSQGLHHKKCSQGCCSITNSLCGPAACKPRCAHMDLPLYLSALILPFHASAQAKKPGWRHLCFLAVCLTVCPSHVNSVSHKHGCKPKPEPFWL